MQENFVEELEEIFTFSHQLCAGSYTLQVQLADDLGAILNGGCVCLSKALLSLYFICTFYFHFLFLDFSFLYVAVG